jgi:hypothetical protein
MSAKSRKSLHDIQTITDRVCEAEKPQRKFIKLAILELDKVRCSKEKRRTCEHMKNLDKRLAEIESEQARLIETVHVVHQGDCPAEINAPHAKKFIQDIQDNTNFKITY